jgi:H+-transporting ATPase
VETFGLLILAVHYLGLSDTQLQSLIFLKLAVAGHLTLMVARTKRRFFRPPYPSVILLGAVLGTQAVAAMIVGFGWFVAPIPWLYVGGVWGYALLWMLVEDEAKLLVYRWLEPEALQQRLPPLQKSAAPVHEQRRPAQAGSHQSSHR